MRVLGYSERGIMTALLYEIAYGPAPQERLGKLLSRAQFPSLGEVHWVVTDAQVLIEQSLSDFGNADAILLIDQGPKTAVVFIEAKVNRTQQDQWRIQDEYAQFRQGCQTERQLSSSNLFTQLYHKVRFVEALKTGGLEALKDGVLFPPCSTKRRRRIGDNPVVEKAVRRIEPYALESYYVALVPDTHANVGAHLRRLGQDLAPEGFDGWDTSRWGYLCWEDVRRFCDTEELRHTIEVLDFNAGQIYRRPRTESGEA